MDVIIGVDVGGTNTVIGVFDKSFSLLKKVSVPTVSARENESRNFLDFLTLEIERVVDSLYGNRTIRCVGMGVPGIVDSDAGIAYAAVNMGWNNLALASEMEQRLGAPVFIDNDVRVYAFGEYMAGSGQGYQHLICVTLGTGIAAGVIIDGKVVSGSKFYAGEIGHDAVSGEKYLCKCGKEGCLETIASANGIARLATEAVANGGVSLLQTVEPPLRAVDVFQATESGDQLAKDIFNHVGRALGTKLVTAAYLLNPEMIIVGGGVAAAGETILQPIRDVFKEQYGRGYPTPIITTGSLGDSAGLIGAAHMSYAKAETRTKGGEPVE